MVPRSRKPLVSICLPVYNGQMFLRQALDSVLAQSFEDFELLISDDCSTDGSWEIIENYAGADKRFTYWRNDARLGLFGNYNKCLEEASGTYIKPFAQDDLWHRELLEKQVVLLRKHNNVALVGARRVVVDELGQVMKDEFQPVSLVDILGAQQVYPGRQVIKACLDPVINLIGEPCAVMFHTSHRGSGFQTIFKHMGDLEYWLRILEHGDFSIVNEPLVSFRRHMASTTAQNVSQLWACSDVVHMAEASREVLAQMSISQEEFVKSSLAINVKFLHGMLLSGELDIAAIREDDEYALSDVAALKKTLLYSLSMLAEAELDAPIGANINYLQMLLNELRIKDAEKIVRGLLSSASWQATRPFRELNKLISGVGRGVPPESLQRREYGSSIERQRAYLKYLGEQRTKILKSRSWRFTKGLRRAFRRKPQLLMNSSDPGLARETGHYRDDALSSASSTIARADTADREQVGAANTRSTRGSLVNNSASPRVCKVGTFNVLAYEYDLAIGAVVRDEAPFLPEWLEYHHLLGVQKFVIFNNSSTDNTAEVLQPYVVEGLVELHDWPMTFEDQPGYLSMQLGAYRRIVDICAEGVKWLALIDIDEFLVPVEADNLVDFLADYNDVGGVSVNWIMFGTSGIQKVSEDKLMIEVLTQRAPIDDPANHFVKTIPRTDRIRRCRDPHSMLYDIGFKQVGTDKRPLFSSMSPGVLYDRLRINHYWTRDEEHFWETKVKQVEARQDSVALNELNRRYLDFNREEDTVIQRFVPEVKARLAARKTSGLQTVRRETSADGVARKLQFSLSQAQLKNFEHELTVAAVFQNEARFLREWIEFHRLVGVQKFLLFNNLSSDDFLPVLKDCIACGLVDLFEWPFAGHNVRDYNQIQCNALSRAISDCKGRSRWLALIDTDEFLYPLQADSLPELLEEYEHYGGLGAIYRVFGTGLVDRIPEGKLLIESLVLRGKDSSIHHLNFKSIVRPELVLGCDNPHYMHFMPGWPLVSERKQALTQEELRNVKPEKLRINHYWSRDEEFFRDHKVGRSERWGVSPEICESNKMELNETTDDGSILRFAGPLRERLFGQVASSPAGGEFVSALSRGTR